ELIPRVRNKAVEELELELAGEGGPTADHQLIILSTGLGPTEFYDQRATSALLIIVCPRDDKDSKCPPRAYSGVIAHPGGDSTIAGKNPSLQAQARTGEHSSSVHQCAPSCLGPGALKTQHSGRDVEKAGVIKGAGHGTRATSG